MTAPGNLRTLLNACVAMAVTSLVATTANAIPLLNGFGGPTGFGTVDHCVHANDDGSYAGPPPTTGYPAVPIDLRPAFIIDRLGLVDACRVCYRQTAKNGHFGHAGFTWEATDLAEALRG